MEVFSAPDGYLIKARLRLDSYKELVINPFNGQVYLHINDVSKCFETGPFIDKNKSIKISMNWQVALKLKNALEDLEPHADQMLTEQVRNLQ